MGFLCKNMSCTGLKIFKIPSIFNPLWVDLQTTLIMAMLWWKFFANNRMDTWKTDVKLFFTITNSQIVHSHLLTHYINYKFMCLSVYWQWKLASECKRVSADIKKTCVICKPKINLHSTKRSRYEFSTTVLHKTRR